MTATAKRDLLFLGGLGAPTQIYLPWFVALERRGYGVRLVPNSPLCLDPATTFAESFVKLAAELDEVDVLGVSYGGNAALYGVSLDAELCRKVGSMVLVCSPILGVPLLETSVGRALSAWFPRHMPEMYEDGEIARTLRERELRERITFELHCIYHPRDLTAPQRTATLPGVSIDHPLRARLSVVPSVLVHEAACVHPETLRTILDALGAPRSRRS